MTKQQRTARATAVRRTSAKPARGSRRRHDLGYEALLNAEVGRFAHELRLRRLTERRDDDDWAAAPRPHSSGD